MTEQEQRVARLQWSRTPPRKEGWWWMKDHDIKMSMVYYYPHSSTFRFGGFGQEFETRWLIRPQWSGPLAPPK